MQLPQFSPSDLAPYTWPALRALLGPSATSALDRDQSVPASMALEGRTDPASLLARLFLLGESLTEAELRIALPSLTSTDGFVNDAGPTLSRNDAGGAPNPDAAPRWRAPFQIVPYEEAIPMWFASDSGQLQGEQHASDHVMGIGGATNTLAALVSYERGQRVLDLGTGCGFHAILAAAAGCSVVATDISERALEYARFNARLNGVDIDFRLGSLFEPVDGSFDVIVSNPPFVITPDSVRDVLGVMEYRDGARSGDTLVADVASQLGEYLTPAGRAYLLANWEIAVDQPWETRAEEWTRNLDSVVVQREVLDPAWYVETWLRDGGYRPGMDGYAQLYRTWLADFEERNVASIGFGFILAGAPASGEPRKLNVELRGASPSSPKEYFDVLWANLDLATAQVLPSETILVQRNVAEHRFYVPGANEPWLIKFSQTDGYGEEVLANTELAGFVSVCDGELTVGQIVAALASVLEETTSEVIQAVEAEVFHMIQLGMLVGAERG